MALERMVAMVKRSLPALSSSFAAWIQIEGSYGKYWRALFSTAFALW